MNLIKRLLTILISAILVFASFSVNAENTDANVPPISKECIDILFLGNSLVYYNDMNTKIFPEMCEATGKKVNVTSITQSGSALYQYASEKTDIGKRTLTELSENTYDYVILQPSRKTTPFEYTVYRAEKEAALKLNNLIHSIGAKTLILAEPGINTGNIPVYTMNEDGISSSTDYSLPIDRSTHSVYVENMCNDFCADMNNAEVVRIGAATEVLLRNFPDYNSLYHPDNKHPSNRGSYLQSLCIYSTIFKENYIGVGYTSSLLPYNALIAQRASSVAVFHNSEEIMLKNELERYVNAELINNSTAKLYWQEPAEASYYEIYQKKAKEKYQLIGRTVSDECEYTISDLEPGTKYSYKIKPIETVGQLCFSVKYSSASVVETLATPSKVSLTLKNRKTVIVDITKIKNADYYNIYRMKIGEDNYRLIGSTSELQYTDSNVRASNTYAYKVTAVKQNGSVESKKSTATKIVSLATPKITITSVKKGRAIIDITAVNGASGYAIYSSVNGGKTYKLIATTSGLKYKIKSLIKGHTYYFKVRAYKEKNVKTRAGLYSIKKIKIK